MDVYTLFGYVSFCKLHKLSPSFYGLKAYDIFTSYPKLEIN